MGVCIFPEPPIFESPRLLISNTGQFDIVNRHYNTRAEEEPACEGSTVLMLLQFGIGTLFGERFRLAPVCICKLWRP
jgi:hypothetical protein